VGVARREARSLWRPGRARGVDGVLIRGVQASHGGREGGPDHMRRRRERLLEHARLVGPR